MPKFALLLIALALSGCVTDDRYARLKPYIGRSVAEFSRDTGLVPSASYDTAQGRVFTVNGPVLAVAVSPGVVAAGGCRMQIETTATNPRGTADDWRIVSIDARGPC
jgi:hypothetical protein